MKNNLLQKMIFGATLLLAAGGCTQDDDLGGNTLPEGKYPLEIASVSLSAEVTDEPWGASHAPQTRVAENPDGKSSTWTDGDKIYVQVGNGTLGTYVLNADGTIDASQSQPAYWGSNANGQTVKAWHTSPNHTSEDGTVTLSNQSGGLAYILKNSEPSTANFGDKINLKFSHALAKVRVVLQGDQAEKVNDIRINTFASCTLNADGSLTKGDTKAYIPMVKLTDSNGAYYWEANVVPDEAITQLQVNGNPPIILDGEGITPLAAKINTITLTVGKITHVLDDDSNREFQLADGDEITVKGNGSPSKGKLTFKIPTGSTAKVNLQDINIQTYRQYGGERPLQNFIKIEGGGKVIFNLIGTNTIKLAGAEVKDRNPGAICTDGSEIVITGDGRLEITGNGDGGIVSKNGGNITIWETDIYMDYTGCYTSMGACIGSYERDNCGNIVIYKSDVEIKFISNIGFNNDYSPAIGPSYAGTCGNVTITLKDGQNSKSDFLKKITLTDQNGNSAQDDHKVVYAPRINDNQHGTLTWLKSDGSPITE